jgi:glucokinase
MSELLDAAQAGDAQAGQEVEAMCRVMGRALYDLIALLDLQRIALGGSVFFHHQALLLPRLIAQVRGRLAPVTDGCELVPAGLGAHVGDYGALALLD